MSLENRICREAKMPQAPLFHAAPAVNPNREKRREIAWNLNQQLLDEQRQGHIGGAQYPSHDAHHESVTQLVEALSGGQQLKGTDEDDDPDQDRGSPAERWRVNRPYWLSLFGFMNAMQRYSSSLHVLHPKCPRLRWCPSRCGSSVWIQPMTLW